MDLTLQPTFLSRQGVLGQAEWRHRLLTGSYNIRLAGIFQRDDTAFLPPPLGAQDRDFRGSFESTGRFNINEKWRWGWDVAVLSDKWFLANYRIKSESIQTLYLKELVSTLYLQGQGDRSWFDARGYYFRGLSSYDWQKQLPVVHPVTDYEKRADGPRPLGGETTFKLNLTSLTREATHFSQIPNINFGLFNQVPAYNGYYETCTVFQRGACLVRGFAGTFTRLSTELTWRRNYVDAVGQVWTPFAYVRADGFWNKFETAGFQNSQILNFVGGDDDFVGRLMPAVGLEYRYPFVAQSNDWGMHVLEPIGQVVARPNETRIGRLPNEDAQSLVFDDTTIFNWDKFSGYDRVEGGVRSNIGGQYSFTGVNGFYANALVGQSYQLAGRNSFRPGDVINVGRDSGLEFARLRRRDAASDQAEPELRLLDPRPLRRERFRDASSRDAAVDELEPRPPARDLGDLRQIRPPARARLRPPARRPSHLKQGSTSRRAGASPARSCSISTAT